MNTLKQSTKETDEVPFESLKTAIHFAEPANPVDFNEATERPFPVEATRAGMLAFQLQPKVELEVSSLAEAATSGREACAQPAEVVTSPNTTIDKRTASPEGAAEHVLKIGEALQELRRLSELTKRDVTKAA